MTITSRLAELRPSTRLKLVATALLALPGIVLIAVALGEIAGGEVSGAQHIPEGGLLLLVALAGWRYPRVAGIVLLLAGVAVLAIWIVFVTSSEDVSGRAPLLVWIGVALLLFTPPILAGWLLLQAARADSRLFVSR